MAMKAMWNRRLRLFIGTKLRGLPEFSNGELQNEAGSLAGSDFQIRP